MDRVDKYFIIFNSVSYAIIYKKVLELDLIELVREEMFILIILIKFHLKTELDIIYINKTSKINKFVSN